MEREAVESFRALERAEKAAGIPELGKRFGKAMADLNENLEHGEWMKTPVAPCSAAAFLTKNCTREHEKRVPFGELDRWI